MGEGGGAAVNGRGAAVNGQGAGPGCSGRCGASRRGGAARSPGSRGAAGNGPGRPAQQRPWGCPAAGVPLREPGGPGEPPGAAPQPAARHVPRLVP